MPQYQSQILKQQSQNKPKQSNMLKVKPFQNKQSKLKNNSNFKNLQTKQNTNFYCYQRLEPNQGLPNVGNTCFLNSAIQFLYSSIAFRNEVSEMRVQKGTFEQNFKSIIDSIKNKQSYGNKYICMKQITTKLRIIQKNYNQYSQEDSLQFLFVILNQLSVNHPKIKKLFCLYYKTICIKQSCKNHLKFSQYALTDLPIQCEKCHSQMKIKFINSPRCIIFQICQTTEEKLCFVSLKNQSLNYKLKAKLIYSGNGNSGHYKLVRRIHDDSDIFYTISDSFISEQYHRTQSSSRSNNSYRNRQNNNYSYQRCLLALYELDSQQKPQPLHEEQNIKNINSNQQQIYTQKDRQFQQLYKKNLQQPYDQNNKAVQLIKKGDQIYLKHMIQFIYQSKRFRTSVLDNLRLSGKTIQKIIRIIFVQFQYEKCNINRIKNNQKINQDIAELARIFNQASISRTYKKNDKLSSISQQNINNLKMALTPDMIQINLLQLLIKQLTYQNSLKDFFYFEFSYLCDCNNQKNNFYYYGYIFQNISCLCCKKLIQFEKFQLINQPKCFILFQNYQSPEVFREFKLSHKDRVAIYKNIKRQDLSNQSFLFLYEFYMLKPYLLPINDNFNKTVNNSVFHMSKPYIQPINNTINKKVNDSIFLNKIQVRKQCKQQTVKQNTSFNKFQYQKSQMQQQYSDEQLFQFQISIYYFSNPSSQRIVVDGKTKLNQLLRERYTFKPQYVKRLSNKIDFYFYINNAVMVYDQYKNQTIFQISRTFKLYNKKQNPSQSNIIKIY